MAILHNTFCLLKRFYFFDSLFIYLFFFYRLICVLVWIFVHLQNHPSPALNGHYLVLIEMDIEFNESTQQRKYRNRIYDEMVKNE